MDNNAKWWDDFWLKQSGITENAGSGDTWYELVWQEGFRYWHSLFERLAPGKNMLECGCGSAKISQYMSSKGYTCTLLDNSAKAIECAQKNFKTLSISGEFILGDINALNFQNERFDIVYSGGVLEFFDDARGPIKEIVRVLKPGGIFAANIIPNKFSIQTIADYERTLVYSFRNMLKGRFRDVFKRVQTVPASYNVSSLSLDGYVDICRESGLKPVIARATLPFPELALPKFGKKLYARLMKKMVKQWRSFNESESNWTEKWGIAYTIYGVKGG